MGAASRSATSSFLENNRQAAGSAPLPLLQVIQIGADPQPQQISQVSPAVADQTAAAATLAALAQMAGPDATVQATQAQTVLQSMMGVIKRARWQRRPRRQPPLRACKRAAKPCLASRSTILPMCRQ
ncbi:hypothetical protein WJX72_005913 [[Myrmecia] bisecta]|uniref:Uncharacterized protein n=1 Tax=[Myrmecia] bisecta TaxID=41462 RepID=A0AAW1QQU4_9CHLO